jgi:hypothetical protein
MVGMGNPQAVLATNCISESYRIGNRNWKAIGYPFGIRYFWYF